MTQRPVGERYRLTLRTLPDDTPLAARLRYVLKWPLHAWGFRAERVEQLHHEAEGGAPPPITADQGQRSLHARWPSRYRLK